MFFIPLQNGDTALAIAVSLGHFDVTEMLLKRGADPNVTHKVYHTVIHFCFINSNGKAEPYIDFFKTKKRKSKLFCMVLLVFRA